MCGGSSTFTNCHPRPGTTPPAKGFRRLQRTIPRDMALRILAKLTELESDPLGFGTTALVSQPERRRLRVGDHRIDYTVDNGQLVVVAVHVGHRSTIHQM
ncbi:type II toxin-antitoxin system RelE/ParE family toxin [Kitasatospora sp. NPDC086791]|uniref:type II toxin-antitoxin system RelE family toxin n=1 Tax=Kitasatospora sp. NPDC086791 TaxID=3155178 RepID=UPI003436A142